MTVTRMDRLHGAAPAITTLYSRERGQRPDFGKPMVTQIGKGYFVRTRQTCCDVREPARKAARSLCCVLILLSTLFGFVSARADAGHPSRILILPFAVDPGKQEVALRSFSQHANSRIRDAISSVGADFVVKDEQATEKLLGDRPPPATEEQALALAAESDADLVIYGFLGSEGAQYFLKGVMWDMRAKRPSVSTDLKVSNIHGLPGVLQLFIQSLMTRLHGSPRLRFYKTEPPGTGGPGRNERLPSLVDLPRNYGPWRSPEINGALSSVDIGDLDGEGKNETVFIQAAEIGISRFDQGSLRTLTQFSESPAAYVSAEVADLDGEGISELLLTYQTPFGFESAIARYVNRNFRITQKFPNMILRSIPDPGNPQRSLLVGQNTAVKDMFSGQMIAYHFDGAAAKEAGTLQLPPGTLLPSYVSGTLGKPKEFVQVILNQDQRLMVFDKENRLLASVPDRIYGLNRKITIGSGKSSRSMALPGRLVIADTDGDGISELLVTKERDGSSMIQGLSWKDEQLVEKWKTVPSRGIISDFCIGDFKNEGIRSLVLLLVKADPFSILTGPRTVVYAHDLVP